MKKLVIGLLAILAVLIGGLVYLSKTSPTNEYAKLYNEAPQVEYAKLLDDQEGTNLYYFYQESCEHCNLIKEDVAKFYYNKPENIDFYLVDGQASSNKDIWYQGDKADFEAPEGPISSYEDIKILGTPTLVEVTDGTVTQFLVGDADIPEYLAELNA